VIDSRRLNARHVAPSAASALLAALVGMALWIVTMASAPRRSYGPDQDMGRFDLFMVMTAVSALLGGYLLPTRAEAIGLGLGLPGFVLSPWTAPQGDNDGLWIWIIPITSLWLVALVALAGLAAATRARVPARDAVRPMASRTWRVVGWTYIAFAIVWVLALARAAVG
jgi:hypothetical protein